MSKSMEWRPIESAPKDGTNVLLFCPRGCNGDDRPDGMTSNIVVGVYRGRCWDHNGQWVCDVVEREYGYYDDCYVNPFAILPTHWMPLPKEPK